MPNSIMTVNLSNKRVSELEAENDRLKANYDLMFAAQAEAGKEMIRLDAENARLRECLSNCIKEGQDKLDTCANEIRSLKSLIAGRDEDLKFIYAEKVRLQSLLASGLLLKRHSADERPEKPGVYYRIVYREKPGIPSLKPIFWSGVVWKEWTSRGWSTDSMFQPLNFPYYGPIEAEEK